MKVAQTGKYAGKERAHWSKLAQPIKGGKAPTGRNVGPISAALESGAQKLAAELRRDLGAGHPDGKGDATAETSAPIADLASHRGPASGAEQPSPVHAEESEPKGIQETQTPGAGGQAAFSPTDEQLRADMADVAHLETVPQGAADTGEAATDADIELLRTQVGKLKWGKPKARSWLKATFGESETKALTKQQAANAFALLLAAGQDETDTAYGVVYDRLKAAGQVL
jgi:hypothetical protein